MLQHQRFTSLFNAVSSFLSIYFLKLNIFEPFLKNGKRHRLYTVYSVIDSYTSYLYDFLICFIPLQFSCYIFKTHLHTKIHTLTKTQKYSYMQTYMKICIPVLFYSPLDKNSPTRKVGLVSVKKWEQNILL